MQYQIKLNNFSTYPTSPWKTFVKGNGLLEPTGDSLRFVNGDTTLDRYSNAQIDDYQGLSRRRFLWRPPLHMRVRARFSHPTGELGGTAGFGFWNDPFLMTGWRRPALPRAVWFFYGSPPSNMKLNLQTPGHGWKGATIDLLRWSFFALVPFAPLAIPLMNIRPLFRLCWPIAQRAIGVSEAIVPLSMTEWHTYELFWQKGGARFVVDGQSILACRTALRGPLGFVMWLDNQFMVVTPWGRFKYGLVATPGRQWMEVAEVVISH